MKRTLIAASFFLGVASWASAADYTLGDTTYTTTTGISSGNGYITGSSFTFTLSNSLFSGTQSDINAITSSSDETTSFASEKLALDKITIIFYGRVGSLHGIQISQGDNIIATSTSLTKTTGYTATDIFDSGAYSSRIKGVWEFDQSTTCLTTNTSYTLTLLGSDGTALSNDSAPRIEVSYCDGTTQAAYIGNTSSHNYQPAGLEIVTLSTISNAPVPEPATATLSLLALAGLAVRRRRQ